MAEAALAGEDHRDARVVRAVDDVPVADRAAGLDDRRDALADADLKPVAEREEGVRHHRAAGQPAPLGLRLLQDLGLPLRAVRLAEGEPQVVERLAVPLPGDPVRALRVRLVARDLRDADAVLLARADADGRAVLHVEDGVRRHARLDEPAEDEVRVLLRRRLPPDPVLLVGDGARRLVRDLAAADGRQEVGGPAGVRAERGLRDEAAVDERLEVDDALRDEVGEARHVADAEDAQVLLRREDVHHARQEVRRDDDLGVVLDDELRRLQVAVAVERDRAAERGEAVGPVRAEVGVGERGARRDAARVVVLDDDGARPVHQVAQDVERIVGVRHVRLAGVLARLQKLRHGGEIAPRLDELDVAKDEVAVDEAVERGLLAGVLAVAEALLLAADVPRHLLVAQGLAAVAVDERNLHLRREVVGLDGLVGSFQVFHGVFLKSRTPVLYHIPAHSPDRLRRVPTYGINPG